MKLESVTCVVYKVNASAGLKIKRESNASPDSVSYTVDSLWVRFALVLVLDTAFHEERLMMGNFNLNELSGLLNIQRAPSLQFFDYRTQDFAFI